MIIAILSGVTFVLFIAFIGFVTWAEIREKRRVQGIVRETMKRDFERGSRVKK